MARRAVRRRVARLKERMLRQADRCCELWSKAIIKRHYFEEWRVAMKEAAMATRISDLEAEMAQMKVDQKMAELLSEWYDMRERRRKAIAEAKAKAEASAERDLRTQARLLRAEIALEKRRGALQRQLLAWYDPRYLRLWRCGVL